MKRFESSVARLQFKQVKELAAKEPVIIFQRYKEDLVLLSKAKYDEIMSKGE